MKFCFEKWLIKPDIRNYKITVHIKPKMDHTNIHRCVQIIHPTNENSGQTNKANLHLLLFFRYKGRIARGNKKINAKHYNSWQEEEEGLQWDQRKPQFIANKMTWEKFHFHTSPLSFVCGSYLHPHKNE